MSDKYQVFVPLDIRWQPSRQAADAAVSLLWSMSPQTDEIKAEFSDALQFRDPGGNWSGVRCAECDEDLPDAWFGTVMIAWHATKSDDLGIVMPCCGASSTLDALRFGAPASFCRFCLVMMNAHVAISDVQITELEGCLGTKLRVIWARV